jgi:hypothetical protein
MAGQISFDKQVYIGRLKRAGIAEDQARAHADAVEKALREIVAARADVARRENRIHPDFRRLENRSHPGISRREHRIRPDFPCPENKIDLAVRDFTIRMVVGAVALFVALVALKYFR